MTAQGVLCIEALRPGGQGAEAENREPDGPEFGRIAMQAPDYDPAQASEARLQRHQISHETNTCRVGRRPCLLRQGASGWQLSARSPPLGSSKGGIASTERHLTFCKS